MADSYKSLNLVELLELIVKARKDECDEKEINKLWKLFNEKYFEYDRFTIRKDDHPNQTAKLKLLLKYFSYDPYEHGDSPELRDAWNEDFQINSEGENCHIQHFRRYFELYPPFVHKAVAVPKKIEGIYTEARWCFIYGQYRGSTALCRAIVEAILKIDEFRIKAKKIKGIYSLKSHVQILSSENILTKKCANKIISRIILVGNSILHDGKIPNKKKAMDALESIVMIIEEVFGKKPYRNN